MSKTTHVSAGTPLACKQAQLPCLKHVQHSYTGHHLIGIDSLYRGIVCIFARLRFAGAATGNRVPICWGSPPCVSV